jgi:hypothetical protein
MRFIPHEYQKYAISTMMKDLSFQILTKIHQGIHCTNLYLKKSIPPDLKEFLKE